MPAKAGGLINFPCLVGATSHFDHCSNDQHFLPHIAPVLPVMVVAWAVLPASEEALGTMSSRVFQPVPLPVSLEIKCVIVFTEKLQTSLMAEESSAHTICLEKTGCMRFLWIFTSSSPAGLFFGTLLTSYRGGSTNRT